MLARVDGKKNCKGNHNKNHKRGHTVEYLDEVHDNLSSISTNLNAEYKKSKAANKERSDNIKVA